MNLAEEATNTEGNALENQQKWVDSFSGKVQGLSTALETLAIDAANGDFLKGLVDVLESAVEKVDWLVEHFGLLSTISVPASGILSAQGLGLT